MANLATKRPWLTARPVAHRGLHDAANGIIENTPGAALAAIAANYAIECDVQITADNEAMVFHDDELDRLTFETGAVAPRNAAELKRLPLRHTREPMPTLSEYCDLIGGRVVLFIELKSRFDGDLRIARRAVDVLRGYKGPFALMSFDPALVTEVRRLAPEMTRGFISESHYASPGWNQFVSSAGKQRLAWMLDAPRMRPQFLAHKIDDLPAGIPSALRALFGIPILTWTVRTDAQRQSAARNADQMIFEGFRA
jgi:glycerophosphoryl diester phosphodiesterase